MGSSAIHDYGFYFGTRALARLPWFWDKSVRQWCVSTLADYTHEYLFAAKVPPYPPDSPILFARGGRGFSALIDFRYAVGAPPDKVTSCFRFQRTPSGDTELVTVPLSGSYPVDDTSIIFGFKLPLHHIQEDFFLNLSHNAIAFEQDLPRIYPVEPTAQSVDTVPEAASSGCARCKNTGVVLAMGWLATPCHDCRGKSC